MEVRRPPDLDPSVSAYANSIVEQLDQVLRSDLRGVYLIGSAALGDYVPGRSDVDVSAVTARPPTAEQKKGVVSRLSHPTLPCPTRGLEFVLYSSRRLQDPRAAGFEINLNTGPGMSQRVSFDESEEPAFWFVLDRSIARQRAVTLFGLAPPEVFPPLPQDVVRDALVNAIDWHAREDDLGYQSVLNGCRSWRFAEEGVWSSKREASEWARERVSNRSLIDQASAWQRGAITGTVDKQLVARFLADVRTRIEMTHRNSSST